MDFLGIQDRTRRDSRLLVAAFVAVLIAMALVVHVAVVGVSMALGGSAGWLEPSAPATAAIVLVWLTALLGGFFRWLDVRAGGPALARRFGATPVNGDDRDARVRCLTGVVAEMAIAASCPPPDVHLLGRESGINAFVVGTCEAPVVVVSRGALDALGRDELRGVVAHEIAHVVHGDLTLNMRVLIVLGALVAIDEVGQTLVGESDGTGRGVRAHPALLIGWPLRALGGIGVLGAGLIRAALSRRREFLADAAAAQFTRQPSALASALATIRDTDEGGVLHTPHAASLAHLCIHADAPRRRWRALLPLSSHPPLQSRIDALDPHVDVKRRKRRRRRGRRAASAEASRGTGSVGVPVDATPFVGTPVLDDTAHARVSVPSDRLALLLVDGADCLAALCALFASEDPIARRDYVGALRFAFDERLAARVEKVLPLVAGELRSDRLGLLEHASGVVRERVGRENRSRILLRLERLLHAGGGLDLCGYATLQLVRRRLDVEFPVVERLVAANGATADAAGITSIAGGRRIKTFDAMGAEFALLLSLMVESSGAPDEVLDREFARVLRCYTSASFTRRSRAEAGIVAELESAFQTLYVQPKAIRRAFVQHCIEIMRADGHVVGAERTLVTLFAASLGCEELAA